MLEMLFFTFHVIVSNISVSSPHVKNFPCFMLSFYTVITRFCYSVMLGPASIQFSDFYLPKLNPKYINESFVLSFVLKIIFIVFERGPGAVGE